MDNKKLVPQIRFKGFHDEWEEIKLGDMFIRLINKNTDNSVKHILTNSAEFGIILQNKFFKNEIVKEKALNRYSIIDINDFTYNPRISSNAPAGPINRNKNCIGCVSPLYINFKIKIIEYIDFYEIYFNSNLWNNELFNKANYGARHDRISIYEHDFFNINIPITNIAEQYKIGNYLINIDTLMSKKQIKLEKIKALKQTLLKKMFPSENSDVPEIRFKGFTEKWEKKKLMDVLIYEQPTLYIIKNFSDNKIIPVITAGKEFILGYTDELNNIFNNLPIILFDDFTTSVQYVDFKFKIKSSACKILKLANDNNLYFLYNLLLLNTNKTNIHKRYWISEYQESKKCIPAKQEQEKIGNYFYKLDNLINLYEKEIEKLQKLKKAFFGKMFV